MSDGESGGGVAGELIRTPLHGEHVRLEGKLVPFAGFEMPVRYPTGITAEHRAVRERAGLFDVSHMGEFEIRGGEAEAFCRYAAVNDAAALSPGDAQYTALCREDGGVLDDCLLYRYDDHFMLVVNAANREKDFEWLESLASGFDVRLRDRSDAIALLALQGPRAEEILAPLADLDLPEIGYYHFAEGEVAGTAATIARTGYTGEDGFELYVDAADAPGVWRRILEEGGEAGVVPAGLGARDSLRLEMGYALYGNDLDEEHTALESGLGWIVKFEKERFVGRAALLRQKEEGPEIRLTGMRLTERAFPREGYPVEKDGDEVGTVTSGILSPTLGEGIAMGYLPAEVAAPGSAVDVVIRDRRIPAETERPPFYTEGSLKR